MGDHHGSRKRRRLLKILVGAAAGIAMARRSRRAQREQQPANIGFMFAIHGALRRDLERLRSVVPQLADRSEVPTTVRDGWAQFRQELEYHHRVEDVDLWPILCGKVQDATALAAIDEMVDEHRRIPPALDAVDRAFGAVDRAFGSDDLGRAVDELATLVAAHLDHEERSVLPLLEQHLSDAEWHDFLHKERRRRARSRRPDFLPWVLDAATPENSSFVLRELPPPGRWAYHRFIEPRYAARALWTVDPRPAVSRDDRTMVMAGRPSG